MANQFQGMTSGLATLKNFYQGPIQDQLNQDVNLWRGSEKGKHAWSGLQVIRPLKIRRNQGVGATSDGGNLPKIGRQGTVQAIIAAKFNYLRFGVTGAMIKASAKDVGSFVRAAAYELEEGYNDLKSDMNRQAGWDGTGYLATVSGAVVASTAMTVTGRESTEAALKFLDIGTNVDVYSTAGVLKASNVEITAITAGGPSSSSATLMLSAAITCADGDKLIRAGTYGLELQGILTALDGGTTTIYNVDRSSAIAYQGNVTDLNGAQLQLNSLQQTEDEAERRGGRDMNVIYSDHASRRMYQKLLQADKRYVNTVKGDGGFADKEKSYLEWNGKPWVADKDFPTRIVMMPQKYFEKYVLSDMEFADETGSMYIADSNVDQFEVRLRLFANMFNAKPAGFGCVTDYVSP